MKLAACVLPVFAVAQEMDVAPSKVFAGGLLTGFFGENSGLAVCVQSGAKLDQDFNALMSDLKHLKYEETMADIQNLADDMAESLEKCKGVGESVTELVQALKDIHSVQDMLHHIKADILQWDEAMLDELEQATKVCTFQDPDAHECGRLIGKGMRQLVVGDSPELIIGEERNKMAFLDGLLSAMIGGGHDIQQCAKDAGDVADDAKEAMRDIKARKIDAAIEDIGNVINSVTEAVSDCKEAAQDLAPYLHIMDDVHSKGDLYNKIKKNALDNDEQVLDEAEDMFSSCTFQKPNAEKCGADLGTIVRLVALGDSSDVVV